MNKLRGEKWMVFWWTVQSLLPDVTAALGVTGDPTSRQRGFSSFVGEV